MKKNPARIHDITRVLILAVEPEDETQATDAEIQDAHTLQTNKCSVTIIAHPYQIPDCSVRSVETHPTV
jgi:hypothetical protein